MMNRLARSGNERLLAGVEALPPTASNRERIIAAARAQLAGILTDREYMSAHARVLQQVPDEVLERHRKLLHEGYAVWRRLVKDAWNAGEIRQELDPTLTAQILMGSLNWSIQWYKPGRLSPEQIADQTVALLFDGMTARQKSRPAGRRRKAS